MSPELRLLVLCARSEAREDALAALVAELNEREAWESFLELSQHHGMLPLAHRRLVKLTTVPTEVRKRLGAYTRQNALRNLGLAHELVQLVDELAKGGIVAVPYKGPMLACAAYGDLSLRSFQDLDLLVKATQFHEAVTLLQRKGYQLTQAAVGKFHASFLEPERGTLLELHHDVLRRSRFPTSFELGPLWDRLEFVELLGRTLPSFPPEETLLLLCLHGAKHEWQGLLWLSDIAAYLSAHPDLDYERLLRNAERDGLYRVVLLGLVLVHDLLGSSLPLVVTRAFESPELRRAQRLVMARWVGRLNLLEEGLLPYRLRYHLQPNVEGRARILWQTATFLFRPNAQDRQALPLPRSLGAATYLVRPLRLASQLYKQAMK